MPQLAAKVRLSPPCGHYVSRSEESASMALNRNGGGAVDCVVVGSKGEIESAGGAKIFECGVMLLELV